MMFVHPSLLLLALVPPSTCRLFPYIENPTDAEILQAKFAGTYSPPPPKDEIPEFSAAPVQGLVNGYQPVVPGKWTLPKFHPFVPSVRATTHSITLVWTVARHPLVAIGGYEVQVRWPTSGLGRADDLRNRNQMNLHWQEDMTWSDWQPIFMGSGRVYRWEANKDLEFGHPFQFRVRAWGRRQPTDGASDWSDLLTAHTLLPAYQERVPLFLRGMGRNNPEFSEIRIDSVSVYRRTDKTGLVLALVHRENLQLLHLDTYDTFTDSSEARRLEKDLLQFGGDAFVVVVSSDAWEMNATPSLAKAMDFCGALHFGTWAHVLADTKLQPSPLADLTGTSSQKSFGHPYAFLGLPGIGTGNGWESLSLPTGHYLSAGHAMHAIVSATLYFDYVARRYRVTEVESYTSPWFYKGLPPPVETADNPWPADKIPAVSPLLPQKPSPYSPYIGTLQEHLDYLMEVNETLPRPERRSINYGMQIVVELHLPEPFSYIDPRIGSFGMTELERVWGGPSRRMDFRTPENVSFLLKPEEETLMWEDRVCYDFLPWRYNASTARCTEVNITNCCPQYDLNPLPRGEWRKRELETLGLLYGNITNTSSAASNSTNSTNSSVPAPPLVPVMVVDPNDILVPYPVEVPHLDGLVVLRNSTDRRVPLMSYKVGMWPTFCHPSQPWCSNTEMEKDEFGHYEFRLFPLKRMRFTNDTGNHLYFEGSTYPPSTGFPHSEVQIP